MRDPTRSPAHLTELTVLHHSRFRTVAVPMTPMVDGTCDVVDQSLSYGDEQCWTANTVNCVQECTH